MKKHLLSLALIFVWMIAALLLPQQAAADPPQDLSLRYDMKAQTLSVSITHKSTFTGFHYIKQIQIKRNDEPFEIQKYESQPGKTTFVYTYKVPAKPNDLLEVTAACNVQGQKTATLKVE
jgi:desulfoferrodoxin (superoxide reductase-like protein)